jgi:hypothetical protein
MDIASFDCIEPKYDDPLAARLSRGIYFPPAKYRDSGPRLVFDYDLIKQLSSIDIGAQAKLRHALPHPVPKAGDIFRNKGDLWPIQPGEEDAEDTPMEAPDHIEYL